ncbi:phosphonate C-P lyase system protein PhnH [Glaciimonas immobilis]|uniref:Alpha-D-ribose 1-methylphosphonate 5-triphosphate synthase subunit PhnH n=1 Tax=Glaciimonas immobilis TaxID=728004 RepID=A0A840S0J2_9BURK|nr:phosphonate C-P lyase system protein PhnH [Glaciimonas immobilis]KAF3997202.1 phosphonate C-P lyase system protein PhnH [Glaciimonas immobilis]MBB5202241.1 alpha-D-ribose 1-methylphosphonate 5-triphosphate synthase subunit PhnH [Glaciimonas immobilis]
MSALPEVALLPAWDDPVRESQATFRAILKALSEPGLVQTIGADIEFPPPLFLSTTALCLALADVETPVWLDPGADTNSLNAYLRFHCGCPLVEDLAQASFAVVTDPQQLESEHFFSQFSLGTMEYPDRSAMLFLQVPDLTGGPQRVFSGPGIDGQRAVRVAGLPVNFDAMWQKNVDGFPRGIDLIFCHGPHILGLPRTTRIVN